ncbi:unnamed protein product [Allacma fusca]|uniref:Uncharacterized protein n=1 Tax=Allacma fusca TaxID=39272 RepID=A0A8J2K5C1_9HEXA|nr:unnamed protein product [Allacma fusca]
MQDLAIKILYLTLDLSLMTLFPPDSLSPLGNSIDTTKFAGKTSRNPEYRSELNAFSDDPALVSPYFGRSGPGVTTGVDFITNLVNANIDGAINVTNGMWQLMQHEFPTGQRQTYESCLRQNYTQSYCSSFSSSKEEYVKIERKSSVNVEKYLTSPEVSESMDMFYGMFRGQPDCIKKTVCIFGSNLNSMPAGRFVLQTWLHMLPSDWKELKRILRKSFLDQENCNLFKCGFSYRRPAPSSSSVIALPIKRKLDLDSDSD